MKARQRQARTVLGLLVGMAFGGSTELAAQRTPQTGPRFMVPTFRSAERNLGVAAAEAIRTRLTSDVPLKNLWVIPKTDITNTLEASGYSTTEALNPNDAKALANLLRAEEYVEGTVNKTPAGYEVIATLQLVRGEGMVQPLDTIRTAKLDQAAKELSSQVQQARRQVAPTSKCIMDLRQKKYAEAVASAKAGIAAYPRATMPRVCLADVYYERRKSADSTTFTADSILRVSEEILKIHPTNRRALALAADAYNETKNEDKYIQTLTTLLAADPTNVRLQTTVVNELARSGKAALAKPIIDDAVKQNPGDPQLIRLQWLVYLALRDYKGAVAIGEEMAKADTSMADTSFFVRLAGAYAADSQFQKGAEAVARGLAKFPNHGELAVLQVQLLRNSGQNQQALEAARRVLASNPKAPNINLQIAQIFLDLNQADSAMTALHNAKAAGDSAAIVGGFALTIGNQAYKAANASKNVEDFRRALRFISFADSTASTDNSKFLLGVTQLTLGQTMLNEAAPKKSCDMAREAQALFTDAQINIAAGGKAFPQQAGQAMTGLQTLSPFADRQVKAFCK